jgi:hypothetical protein
VACTTRRRPTARSSCALHARIDLPGDVDLRTGSATREEWLGVDLSAASERRAYVPEGFAQGYQPLEDDTEVPYQMSHHFVPGAPAGCAGTTLRSASTGPPPTSESSPSAIGNGDHRA